MGKKVILSIAVLVTAFSLLMFNSCKKSTSTSNTDVLSSADDNGGYASDNAKLEATGNSVLSIADNAVMASGSNLRTTGCVQIYKDSTVSGSTATHVITVDFGSGCTGFDGRTRSGQIIITWTGRYKDSGSTHTITANNFYVDGYKVAIHKSVTNMGMNTSAQDYYNVTVADSIYLTSDSIISWTGNRTRTWLQGESTQSILDDVYSIGGNTTVTRANGHSFTFTIDAAHPLIVATNCRWVEAGTVDITSTTFATPRILNYGDVANCDNNATLTIGTHVYNITLR